MSDEPPDLAAQPAILLEGVHKAYFEGEVRHPVLEDASVSIPRGELVILLGRSGSGKSTLLNLIGAIDLPDRGRVAVAGTDLSALSERERTLFRRRHLGFVFQFFNLIPTLTVEENLLLRLQLNGRDDTASRRRAGDLLDEVGLADRAASWPDRLSGGEQQRVAIASALAHDPDLILADEPTGNLDLETGQRVIDLLDRLSRRSGKTLLMATHSAEVMGLADRILTIEGGALRERIPDRSA